MIDAAELAQRVRKDALSLTAEIPEAEVRMDGRLTQVSDLGAGIMIMMRGVEGLAGSDICSATIAHAAAGIDECLARIGKGGRITLTGLATASPETVARVRMHRIDTICGRTLAAIEAQGGPAEPVPAAELHRRTNGGLERYAQLTAQGLIQGRLKDVGRGGAPGEAFITVDHIEGLDGRQFCIARLRQTDAQSLELLKTIGRGGRIRLTGTCSADADGLAAATMDPVDTIEHGRKDENQAT